ncbi:RdgB/HAM1 family non-canonical purine NTP pyrophosphatase [Legionella longbeachae]|uniref:dITP/XTP pyrophosphatase n=1 Tax=Legionella longbeachae serogroup 1 (strain NSW150) TaxID=661367 RepID=D3HM20_LEGLN|nr:RdgB/HAM1 family non-canonical purine NTP pyrophosphatase [Legionella longbeachae]VEE03934.1 dITP/XTP pyrophosphatase [Legionella oakridgensis]HBD7397286.1 RdgB/HAM1 family non-canonical purine NTP pyrophosphatase [Legionella pneumophila]ARB93210.1 non-canonical purine NTP pyrophosphatase, RdgB/HAM1 family [Legionella longbeachae]ARM33726.1 RdgB/HAM1 family non-canonical purine NTP pyrophosphatase [Legionella longbeachae]EEZ97119.1 nucleoside-triphosphatase [Legionella longbeachae D-4968]
MKKIVLATSNAGKIKELNTLLTPIECIPQATLGISDAVENGLSFIENALIKARHASLYANEPALADDSGLVVPALNGDPGIYSARYAGSHATDVENINLLLENMSHLTSEHREAWFYCAIALVQHAKDPTPIITTGICKGFIHDNPAGEGGFGYDPIFYLPEYQCTMAQLPAKLKNNISHRAQALKQLRNYIQNL